MSKSNWKIYHNPRCSKSRQTLALLKEKGIEPEVIEYLSSPPSAKELREILSLLNIGAEKLLRKKEAIFKELKLDLQNEDQLIEAMIQHGKLIERPIVVKDNQKAVLGRPPENILKLL